MSGGPPSVESTLAALETLATEGRLDAARAGLDAFASARIHDTGGHGATGKLAQTLGMARVAERELRLAIRDARGTPDEARWSDELAALQHDLGELAAASRTRGRLVKAGTTIDAAPAPHPEPELAPPTGQPDLTPSEPPRPATDPRLTPSPADLSRFLHLFQGREDVHARQWLSSDGRVGYAPVHRPLTREAVLRHLAGTETLGVYATRADLTACFFAIDVDLTRPALEAARRSIDATRRLRRVLHEECQRMLAIARSLGLDLVVEDSGYKGRHLWGFLAEPMPVGLLRNLGRALARALAPESGDLVLESFPKQARLEPGQIGNLIKLPLGVHLRTGRRAWLLDDDGRPDADPWKRLRAARRHRRDEILDVMARLRQPLDGSPAVVPGGAPAADHQPRAAGLPARAAFVEADLAVDPELRVLFGGCAVLRVLVDRARERRRLTHEEQMVLRHVLGYRPSGLLAVNYVFSRCPEIGRESFLQSQLAGHPMSCPKIRKRVPDVTARVPCNCEFKVKTDHYPTPLLHLDEARARGLLPERAPHSERVEPAVVEDWARKVAHTREQIGRLQAELQATEQRLAVELAQLEGGRLVLEGGTWKLDGDGRPEWVPGR
ncbi:MAG: hypothetical protein IT385_28680 [Deltaproteobacteria bacterium]|nr:hypothetical protein [Deltaproteobacteria bacterium]